MYDMGMKLGTCVEHVADMAQFERTHPSTLHCAGDRQDESSESGGVTLRTALMMAIHGLTADARAAIAVLSYVVLVCLLPTHGEVCVCVCVCVCGVCVCEAHAFYSNRPP